MDVFTQLERHDSHCAAHTLAEFYAVMTRLPVKPRISPDEVTLFWEAITERLSAVTLSEREYVATLREAAGRGISGGKIYDALILACAKKCRAEAIYTLNHREFPVLAPDLAGRIRTP